MLNFPARTRSVFDRRSGGTGAATVSDVDGDSADGGEPTADEGRAETGEFVHECPSCQEVYLSDGPRRCSTCDVATAPVAAPTDD